jgi:hypothetical protein
MKESPEDRASREALRLEKEYAAQVLRDDAARRNAPALRDALYRMERLARTLFGDGDDIDGTQRARCLQELQDARDLLGRIEYAAAKMDNDIRRQRP